MNIISLEKKGHAQKSRNHEHEGIEGSHISKSKSYKSKRKQDNTDGVFEHIFSINLP